MPTSPRAVVDVVVESVTAFVVEVTAVADAANSYNNVAVAVVAALVVVG